MPDASHPAASLTLRRGFHRAPESERRESLIAATLESISELGVDGATVREIALRAGVTAGLVRHYFQTKDQLVQTAYRQFMRAMTVRAGPVSGDAESRLFAFIAGNLHEPVANSRNVTLWAAFVGQVRVDRQLASIHRESYLEFRQVLEDLIRGYLIARGQAAGRERCRRHAIAINGLIDGLWLECGLAGELFETRELAGIALAAARAILDQPADQPIP